MPEIGASPPHRALPPIVDGSQRGGYPAAPGPDESPAIAAGTAARAFFTAGSVRGATILRRRRAHRLGEDPPAPDCEATPPHPAG